MRNKKLFLFLPLILTILVVGVFAFSSQSTPNPSPNSVGGISYGSNVCKQVIRADGTREPVECSHNVLYDTGRNMTRDLLGNTGGDGTEIDEILLCNASTADGGCGVPVKDQTENFIVYSACGLTNATGTYNEVLTGNWTISNEFTSTCDNVVVNATRLANGSAYFAGNNFTLVTLQQNDRLLINWTIYIS